MSETFDDDVMSENYGVFGSFGFMADLEQSRSQFPDKWSKILKFFIDNPLSSENWKQN